jgi:hypothetical protein
MAGRPAAAALRGVRCPVPATALARAFAALQCSERYDTMRCDGRRASRGRLRREDRVPISLCSRLPESDAPQKKRRCGCGCAARFVNHRRCAAAADNSIPGHSRGRGVTYWGEGQCSLAQQRWCFGSLMCININWKKCIKAKFKMLKHYAKKIACPPHTTFSK